MLRRRPWVWLLALLVLPACNAKLNVTVLVSEDGSGVVETTVHLDAEATEALLDLDLDASGLLLNDLAQAGWVTSAPETDASGETIITASKAFGTPEQFAQVLAELSGSDGVFQDFGLQREKSFARVDYAVIGVLDPTGDLETFGDEDLTRLLGRSLESIAEVYGATGEDVSIELEVMLPGTVQEDASSGVMVDGGEQRAARWLVTMADNNPQEVQVSSATRQVSSLVLRGVAVVAGVLAAIIVFAQLLRIIFPERRRGRGRGPRAGASTSGWVRDESKRGEPSSGQPVPSSGPLAAPHGELQHKVVALDAMGVLYQEGDDFQDLLIPFARERGSQVSDDEIVARARSLTLGRITPAELWELIGVAGNPRELDAAYLSRHQLTPGVVKYLRALRDRGVRVACVTNDAAAWAQKLKIGHSLDALIEPWVISGSIGVRKPDRPIFEVLRRVTGEPPSQILVVDDDLDVLDVARDLGFATAWFSASGSRNDARNHGIIRSFDMEEIPAPAPASAPAGSE